jgi:hypothetical protein
MEEVIDEMFPSARGPNAGRGIPTLRSHSMKRLGLLSAILVLLASTTARADDKPAVSPQKRLEYFVGKWDVAVKFKLPDGKEGQGKAACEIKSILGGKFLHQEYKSKFMGQDLTVVQILGFDEAKNKFVEFDMHVEGTNAMTMYSEGSLAKDGKTLTLTGDTLDMMTGKPTKMKTVTTMVDADNYTLEWFFPNGDKMEQKVLLKHTRKK